MIKVLIVDDSKVVQEFMQHILTSDPEIKIVGIASSGREAIELVREKRPDIITMDFHMPGMNGAETTRAIMATNPTPIVIVSGSLGSQEVTKMFSLIEDGALAVVLRPPGPGDPDFIHARDELIQTLKLMSEIKVVKVFSVKRETSIRQPALSKVKPISGKAFKLIAIGASTGGPMALQRILSRLPMDLQVPVLIVQHIAAGFVEGFVEWLSWSSRIPVKIAENGEVLLSGTGYVAPEGYHMGIMKGLAIMLSKDPPENGLRPSVNHLFRSVSETLGRDAIGVLLSGMGTDGAHEMKTMNENGAVTIVQNEESSVIFGMPGEALRLGAASHVLPIDQIADFLAGLLATQNVSYHKEK